MTGDLPAQLRARADSLAFIRTDPDLVALLRDAADLLEKQWRAIETMAAAAGPAWTPRWVNEALEDTDAG